MTTYFVFIPNSEGTIVVSSDIVLDTPPCLAIYIGQHWELLRQNLEQLGFEIQPCVQTNSDWVRVKGVLYELHWSSNRQYLKRISKHFNGKVTNITYNSLPLLIKNAL
jgi:hypothetical protein